MSMPTRRIPTRPTNRTRQRRVSVYWPDGGTCGRPPWRWPSSWRPRRRRPSHHGRFDDEPRALRRPDGCHLALIPGTGTLTSPLALATMWVAGIVAGLVPVAALLVRLTCPPDRPHAEGMPRRNREAAMTATPPVATGAQGGRGGRSPSSCYEPLTPVSSFGVSGSVALVRIVPSWTSTAWILFAAGSVT